MASAPAGGQASPKEPVTAPQPAPAQSGSVAGEGGAPRAGSRRQLSWMTRAIALRAVWDSFLKLDPRAELRNPVMFVVFVGTAVTAVESLFHPSTFNWVVTGTLFFTLVFANFAEATAEGRGRAQAASLRRMRAEAMARRLVEDGHEERVPASTLQRGDLVVCEAHDVVPSDGEVVEGVASIDESAITGESAPVIRESGGDRSSVTGGTQVLSDRIVIRITAEPGKTFLERMIRLVEGADRQKTPNELALTILLAALTLIFLPVCIVLAPYAGYAHGQVSVVVLVALLVCLIPTTIGALLSAIGIAGMDRLVQRNVLAMSGRAVEAAGDVSTLLLDKTGTITLGNRMATTFIGVGGTPERELAAAAQLASLADDTPEGRSIVVLAKQRFGLRARDLSGRHRVLPFSATTRMSGIDLGEQRIRKGAGDAVRQWVKEQGGTEPPELADVVERLAREGATPLVVADGARVLGVVDLRDVVKSGIKARFEELRRMGIRTVMVTGDNRLTAATIASEAGVDDFLAEATPEAKLELIRQEQAGGRLVAMAGDGTNDAPALAQADVGVAMNTGTMAAKEAGNMVDLDSNPTKLIQVVEIGKQLLITRGALTTFSIANDVAKYFAIIPALFVATYPQLRGLNILGLHSPHSAVLSAVIFNALVIVALIPLALRGVRYRPARAQALLRRNLAVYGVGGLIVPFVGIKLIDLAITALRIA
ncbi:MAG: potassium-transporting ATPase subunit KdpB [Candidatus Dormibacteria bacterium]